MTFWQGLVISIIFHASENSDDQSTDDDSVSDSSSTIYSASSLQHILICMEMLFFSAAHWCVFPAEEWEDGYKAQRQQQPGFGFRDFASDVNLIIDSGKRSMKARREEKRKSDDTEILDDSSKRTSPTFGSMDVAEERLDGNGSLV